MEWDMRGAKIGQGSKSGKGATEVRHGLTSHGHVFCGMKSEDRLFPLDWLYFDIRVSGMYNLYDGMGKDKSYEGTCLYIDIW